MRSRVVLALLPLAGCATAEPAIPVHGETPGHVCRAEPVQHYSGTVASARIGGELLAGSHAAVLRWAPPGVMLTMDYRADRLTVRLDPGNVITGLACG